MGTTFDDVGDELDRVREGIRHVEHEVVKGVRRGLTRAERDLSDGLRRWRLSAMHHPVRGLMDATAAVAAVVGAIWLLDRSAGPWPRQLAIGVYAASLVGVFTVSALYHSVPWREAAKRRMQKLDHTMIFFLVAGTYSPIALIVLDGWMRTATLAAVWSIAVVGAAQKWILHHVGLWLSITLQTVQGWLALLVMVPLVQRLPTTAVGLIVAGGVLYTVGLVMLIARRPFLWPRYFSYHEAMHVLVIAAAACHFAMIARYVAPVVG